MNSLRVKTLCFKGTWNNKLTEDTVMQTGSFLVATHQKQGWASHRQQDKPQHISGQAPWSLREWFSSPIKFHSSFIKESLLQELGPTEGWSSELKVPSPFPVIITDQWLLSLKYLWSNYASVKYSSSLRAQTPQPTAESTVGCCCSWDRGIRSTGRKKEQWPFSSQVSKPVQGGQSCTDFLFSS